LSKFRIYRADSADPRKTGRQNKKMYMAYAFLTVLVSVSVNIHITSGSKKTPFFYYIVVVILIVATVWIVIEMKKQSRSLHKIGSLEFTRSSIIKRIGDLSSASTYNDIAKIEIERYLRDLSVNAGRAGSTSYILKITRHDRTEENFVISDKSMDFSQKISIHDTLRTLRNTAGLNYVIKNN
jgi:hypothetical protein